MKPIKLPHEQVEVLEVDLAKDAGLNMVGEVTFHKGHIAWLGFPRFVIQQLKQLDAIASCFFTKLLELVRILKDVVEAGEQPPLLLTHGIRHDRIRREDF